MRFLVIFLMFLVFMPVSKASTEEIDIAGVEENLLKKDIESAKALVEKTGWNTPLRSEVKDVINCVENLLWFYTYSNQQKDVNKAIAAYPAVMQSYNELPAEIPFSEKFVKNLNDAINGAKKFINKECGKDYSKIRVGMKLERVQKCVGEFYLQGQTEKKGAVYDYYTRGDSWLYVKKGRIVAWGD